MNLVISGRHMAVTPAIRGYIESKLSRIRRHFDHVIDVSVILTADFHLLCEMVRGENHADVDDVIKMPPDPGKFALDVTADRRRDRHVTPADDQIHARRAFASKRFSHAHGRYLQRLAVLRDGATCDHDALLAEDLGDLAVRKGFPGILRGNQLLEQRPDSGRRAGAPSLGGDVTPEEVLELENAAPREHELLSRDARDGGLVQADGSCGLA